MKERDDENLVREKLEQAGKRPDVPAEPMAEIIDATRAVWQQRYGRRRTMRRAIWMLPIAAALIAGFFLFRWKEPRTPVAAPPVVAIVERASGMLASSFAAGQRLAAGESIEIAGGTLALRLNGGQSLRVNSGTRIRLASATLAQLEFGSVYLDCPMKSDDVTIRTTAGDFQPVGTQFEVRAERNGATELRVREGVVSLMRRGERVTARAGEALSVNPNGGLQRGRVAPDADIWSWVVDAAPMPEIEGKTLRSFLEWIAREKGLTLRFADDRAASLSTTVILHGSVASISPDEALQSIALSSGFAYQVIDGTLTVSVRDS